MATFENAVKSWTETINNWYHLDATPEEVEAAFHKAFDGRTTIDGADNAVSYASVFFMMQDGSWSCNLDTADREYLADMVELARGHDPLPTYAELGHGQLFNKAPGQCYGKCGKQQMDIKPSTTIDLKIALYRKLLAMNPDVMSNADIDIMFSLANDSAIQTIFENRSNPCKTDTSMV